MKPGDLVTVRAGVHSVTIWRFQILGAVGGAVTYLRPGDVAMVLVVAQQRIMLAFGGSVGWVSASSVGAA